MVIVLDAHEAVTPAGKLDGTPMPVAPVVVCVTGVSAVLIHRLGEDDAAPTVLVAITVTALVVLLQFVVDEVNVKVADPAATPVTTPAEVTVATDGLLLTHVPPVVGDKVVVAPMHIELLPVMLTVGNGLTVTDVVVLLQFVVDEVNVKVADLLQPRNNSRRGHCRNCRVAAYPCASRCRG